MKFETGEDLKSFKISLENGVLAEENGENHFLYVGSGTDNMHMFRGNFDIKTRINEKISLNIIKIINDKKSHKIAYSEGITLEITEDVSGEGSLELRLVLSDEAEKRFNRFWFRLNAEAEERIYGGGEQFSHFNLRGRNYPMWVSEPGNGRSKGSLIKFMSDRDSSSGGEYYMTYFPQRSFVSSKKYLFFADSSDYADFDFSEEKYHELDFHGNPKSILIKEDDSYEKLAADFTEILGKQEMLPDWIMNGTIIGLQGGTDRMQELLNRSLENKLHVNAVFVQDWSGKINTDFGYRVYWNWQWNPEKYPDLPRVIKENNDRGVRFMGYINPYLIEGGSVFKEASEKGLLMKNKEGQDYLIDVGGFRMGTIDLTNPKAFDWYKGIIKENMIDLGMSGWMADFGEYIPTDAVFYNGEPAVNVHNAFPALWARCNYEAVKESGKIGEIVYFMRSGGAGSQKYSTLAWNGDQSVDYSLNDGLPSAINATLSLAMSGYGICHSDIGGYTSIYDNLRDKDLFLRWAEMAAFTPVMRTHEGNRPSTNFQYYDDPDAMRTFARLVDIHDKLNPYIKDLVQINHEKGIPVQRPLVYYYEEEAGLPEEQMDGFENVNEDKENQEYLLDYKKNRMIPTEIKDEFLLGKDMLVAPVHEKDARRRTLYLPDEKWINIWTGERMSCGKVTVDSSVGYPPVFYKEDSGYRGLFEEITKQYGL